jgi:hypothetical protein
VTRKLPATLAGTNSGSTEKQQRFDAGSQCARADDHLRSLPLIRQLLCV